MTEWPQSFQASVIPSPLRSMNLGTYGARVVLPFRCTTMCRDHQEKCWIDMGVSQIGGTPKLLVYKRKSQSKMDDFEVPLVQKAPYDVHVQLSRSSKPKHFPQLSRGFPRFRARSLCSKWLQMLSTQLPKSPAPRRCEAPEHASSLTFGIPGAVSTVSFLVECGIEVAKIIWTWCSLYFLSWWLGCVS